MLRQFYEIDLPRVLAIEQATQLSPWSEAIFRSCLEAGYELLVIVEDNEVAGFIMTSREAGESHILNLCVHPDFQHQGLGRKLLTAALTAAKNKGTRFVWLEVRSSNIRAIALYNQMGFVQISERKNYYPGPSGRENAVIFAKDLRAE